MAAAAAALPFILPILSGVGSAVGIGSALGIFGDDGQEVPAFEQPVDNAAFDSQAGTENARIAELRRQAISRSRTLTNIQDNPVDEDSLLDMLSRR